MIDIDLTVTDGNWDALPRTTVAALDLLATTLPGVEWRLELHLAGGTVLTAVPVAADDPRKPQDAA